MVNIMDNADSSLLPAVYKEVGTTFQKDPTALNTLTFYKEVGTTFQKDPTALNTLTFYRSFVQCLCYPFAAYLAKHHNRAHLIALGAFL
ncbi:Putative ovule protein [Arachis hypogaea]|nr:Putative ovule protein [Arachis hypogaea]